MEGEGTIKVDPQIMKWISDSKECWTRLSGQDRQGPVQRRLEQVMGSASKVFAFLLPAWGIDFTLAPTGTGPRAPGPSLLRAGVQLGRLLHPRLHRTDNIEHVRDIILALTRQQGQPDQDLEGLPGLHQHRERHAGSCHRRQLCLRVPGRQNAYEYFAPVAENIKIRPLSSYDQGCVELIQNAFSDYYQGNVDFDRARRTSRPPSWSAIPTSPPSSGRTERPGLNDTGRHFFPAPAFPEKGTVSYEAAKTQAPELCKVGYIFILPFFLCFFIFSMIPAGGHHPLQLL